VEKYSGISIQAKDYNIIQRMSFACWITKATDTHLEYVIDKGKTVPLQAWSGPERSRKLRFPDFTTTAQDGNKVVSLTHRPLLPPGNKPGTHFC
jgi:hypothetical protein